MGTVATDTLNSLLRGELAATETYQQALANLGDERGADELRKIHVEHREAANALRLHVRDFGEKPDKSSGAWGAFAKTVEGSAKLFGNKAALKALKEGEEHGIKEYEEAIGDGHLPGDGRILIETTLLPQARKHIPVLDGLMAGLVERISPEVARQHLEFNESAILVCAYDDEDKFRENHLEGAFSLDAFKVEAESIPKDSEIIFYCA
jgi:uncharacterized protein (TIGR02284 family)